MSVKDYLKLILLMVTFAIGAVGFGLIIAILVGNRHGFDWGDAWSYGALVGLGFFFHDRLMTRIHGLERQMQSAYMAISTLAREASERDRDLRH